MALLPREYESKGSNAVVADADADADAADDDEG